jgi:hypothetical protein
VADILRIKRRALGGAVGAPASLAVGELAFNEQDGGLYIGRSNGSVAQINSGGGGGGGSITISDTPPGSPTNGQLWWESDSGTLYMWYTDANSSQWIGVGSGSIGAPLVSPVFTGDPQAPTPTAGDNDNSISTTAFVRTAITAGIAGLVATKTSAYSIIASDFNSILNVSGTWTLGHTVAAAAAGAGFVYTIRNTGNGTITIDPAGSETIDGGATLLCLSKQQFQVVSDGANWFTIGRSGTTFISRTAVNGVSNSPPVFLPPGYSSFDFEVTGSNLSASAAYYMQIATDGVPNFFTSGYYNEYTYHDKGTVSAGAQLNYVAFLLSHTAYPGYGPRVKGKFFPGNVNPGSDMPGLLVEAFVTGSVGDGTNYLSQASGYLSAGGVRATHIQPYATGAATWYGSVALWGNV